MTQYENVVALVKALLESVPDVGIVHDRLRFATDPQKFLEYFKTTVKGTPQIRGWLIEVPAQPRKPATNSTLWEIFPVKLIGYCSWNEEANTYREFAILTETVADKFSGRFRLGDTSAGADGVANAGPASITKRIPATLGGVLVHYCEIELPVRVQRTFTAVP